MKWFFPLLVITVMSSCSKELHTTKKTIKFQDQIITLSHKLFKQFNQETFFTPRQLDSIGLSKAEIRLLTNKLKCPYVHLTYDYRHARFLRTDSIVIFTRTGFPVVGHQYNVVVDMRVNTRDSIRLDRSYLKYYPIAKGIYYVEDFMPIF